jgi:hypothetical protein
VKRLLFKAHISRTYDKFHGHEHDYVSIGDRDVPMWLRHELSTVANYKDRKSGSELTVRDVERLVAEQTSRFLCELRRLERKCDDCIANE